MEQESSKQRDESNDAEQEIQNQQSTIHRPELNESIVGATDPRKRRQSTQSCQKRCEELRSNIK